MVNFRSKQGERARPKIWNLDKDVLYAYCPDVSSPGIEARTQKRRIQKSEQKCQKLGKPGRARGTSLLAIGLCCKAADAQQLQDYR